MKRYKRVFIEITNACNLSCAFCLPTSREKQFMDTQTFQRIIDQVKALADEVVLHVLGEPLLHPKVLDYIDYVLAAGLQCMLTTNGTLLSGRLAEELMRKKLRQLNISLHAIQLLPNKKDYYRNILGFIRIAQAHDPELYINVRFWNKARYQKKRSRRISGRVYLHRDVRFEWPVLSGPVLQTTGFCHGLGNHFAVLVDGTVVPCCLDGNGVMNLGNVHEKSISEILETVRAQNIADGFTKNHVIENLCQRCEYMRRFSA